MDYPKNTRLQKTNKKQCSGITSHEDSKIRMQVFFQQFVFMDTQVTLQGSRHIFRTTSVNTITKEISSFISEGLCITNIIQNTMVLLGTLLRASFRGTLLHRLFSLEPIQWLVWRSTIYIFATQCLMS